MKLTATQLVTAYKCPFLWYVSYKVKQPLPVWGTHRAFGLALHAAIAMYERQGQKLGPAFEILEGRRKSLKPADMREAREILEWHDQYRQGEGRGRPVLMEGSLSAQIAGHRLNVRMDRLDQDGDDLVLVEYKGGKRIDLEEIRIQMTVLSYAVYWAFGKVPARWTLQELRNRRTRELDAERDPLRLRSETARLARQIAREDREPRPYKEDFCRRCPAKSYCPRGSKNPKPLRRLTVKHEPQLQLF